MGLLMENSGRHPAETKSGAVAEDRRNVYTRLGVRPIINARGTWTYMSGSLELPEVTAAKQEASHYFVDMFELHQAAGERLAALTGAEFGMITPGAAAAMALATAACLAGSDPEKIRRLPDTAGMRSEVVLIGEPNPFANAIRLVGARPVSIATIDALGSAIGPGTAMLCTTMLGNDLERVLEIARKAGIPLLLDDAAGIPPFDNLHLYARMGVDLYAFSGGKGLRGPQNTGVLLGRRDLIQAALANSSPWEGAPCRAMKVSKEDIIGCLTAIEVNSRIDSATLQSQWTARVLEISRFLNDIPGVRTRVLIPELANRYPTLDVAWDPGIWGYTPADCYAELRAGEPRIEVLIRNNPSLVSGIQFADTKTLPDESTVRIVSMTIQPGEEIAIGRRLRQVLTRARNLKNGSEPASTKL
jgi:L-seryl-tRNA(Ser) seleniumtransferase